MTYAARNATGNARTRGRTTLLLAALAALIASAAHGVGNEALPVPANNPHRAQATRLYNDGVALLAARDFAGAQGKFEAALAVDEKLAEAHNNLAYALRMQGRQNFASSLAHYDRAIELKPDLAQAYMYRGVLFVQQGDLARARQDLERLRTLEPKLATDLERVVESGDAGTERGGIAGQYK